MRPIAHLGIALIAVVACGCTSLGSDEDSSASVDLSRLETGNYQSVPRNADEAKADQTGLAIEAVRLGGHMPIPLDIDSSYGFQSQNNQTSRVTPDLPISLSRVDPAEFKEFTPGLIVGWSTSGHRRLNSTVGRQAFLYNFRFSTSAEAEAALGRIVAEQQRLPSTHNKVVSIPGFPKAQTNWDLTDLDSWMTHGSMLLGVRMVDLLAGPPNPDPSIEFTAKAYTKIIEMVAGYIPTPTSELSNLPVDTDGMLSRTLPGDPDSRSGEAPDGVVETIQAALVHEHRPGTTKPALIDAGVDIVSSEGDTRVYRAETAEAANSLLNALLRPNADYRRAVDSPPSLPIAKCFEATDSKVPASVDRPVCYVTFDRYVAEIESFTLPDLHQRTAAQYKLLAVGR